jgi:hypothetical protein
MPHRFRGHPASDKEACTLYGKCHSVMPLCMEPEDSPVHDDPVVSDLRAKLAEEQDRRRELQALCAQLRQEALDNALAHIAAAEKLAEAERRMANDSLAIERLEGKWAVEVVDRCEHDEKTWVCCSDCLFTSVQAARKAEAELREEREKREKLVEAADWVEHLICGVGKAGDPPTPDEWEEAHEALRAALAPFQPTEKQG